MKAMPERRAEMDDDIKTQTMDTSLEPVSKTVRRRVSPWLASAIGVACALGLAVTWYNNRTDSLSPRDLSTALGIHHWRYTIPKNDGTKVLTFELRDGDTVKAHGGSNGWTPGETVTITARPLMDSRKLECSIIGKAKHGRFLLDNPFAALDGIHYAPDGVSVNDLPLIQGNHNGTVVIFPPPHSKLGNVSLWVVMSGD